MRLIDADELINNLVAVEHIYPVHMIRAIKAMPTIEAKPVVRGEWKTHKIQGNRKGTVRRICSVCRSNNGNRKSPYCPNCGAKMVGGKET